MSNLNRDDIRESGFTCGRRVNSRKTDDSLLGKCRQRFEEDLCPCQS